MMFRSCYILLLLIMMEIIMGNNSTEFSEIKDGKRRDIPIISVNNTAYANSTVFPTINKGEAVEDMEQTRVKIGVKKPIAVTSAIVITVIE